MGTLSQRLTDVPIINIMSQAAFKAARSLIRDFNEVENLVVSKKGPGDFVSCADKRAEKIIYNELKKSYPDYGFLMEETGRIESDSPYCWVIDPLDGTRNFLYSVPHFCISIALLKNGEPQAGVIYDPICDELFWSEKARGSFLNNRRIGVARRRELKGSMVFATLHNVYSSSGLPQHRACFDELFKNTTFRVFGSAALSLAYVAAGRCDAYIGFNLGPWDVASGILIAQQAGASVYPFKGKQDILSGESIIATNEDLIMPIERIFKSFSN